MDEFIDQDSVVNMVKSLDKSLDSNSVEIN